MVKRCSWVPADDELYCAYHDEEWGVPEYDSKALFEKLILDGFQAGLSWRTILYKRDNFRKAFKGFDPEIVAHFKEKDVTRLLGDAGIIRHRGKIEGAITNAKLWLEMRDNGEDFSEYLWNHVDGNPLVNKWKKMSEVPAKTTLSEDLSKDLKKRGFKFCGPTIIYAFMQAVGMVNDHTVDCHRYKEV
ncbi:MAG: DNA-3-methyladenine glycosylase I [bacterium]